MAEIKPLSSLDLVTIYKKASPYIGKAFHAIEVATPYVKSGWEKLLILSKKAEPFQHWGPAIFGLFLVFFGGRFLSTIAAAEAMRLMGFDRFLSHLRVLWQNYQTGVSAALKDEDASPSAPARGGSQVAVKTSDEDKALRTFKVILKSVDPKQVTGAVAGIYEILLAVIATLRLKFAASVTLGCSMGDIFFKAADKFARPHLENGIPAEYHKWIEPTVGYTCKAIGVSLAWMLQRVMSAVHCSLRGAQIVVTQGQKAAVQSGLLQPGRVLDESSPVYTVVVAGVALVGFLNQLVYGFGLPFPLNVLFLPVYILEWLITEIIGGV